MRCLINGSFQRLLTTYNACRYRPFQKSVSFDVDKVISGDRGQFGAKGPLEEASEALLHVAQTGDLETLGMLLDDGEVDADVSDVKGFTPLLAATVCTFHSCCTIFLLY